MGGDAAELTTPSSTEPTGPTAPAATDAPADAPAAATPETAPTAEAAASPDEQFQKWLTERDPDELIRANPKLAGKVGELADKQARKLRQQWEADQAQREVERQAEADRTRRLEEARQTRDELDQDPVSAAPRAKALLDAELKREEEADARRLRDSEQSARQQELMSAVEAFQDELPEPIRKEIAGKAYPGTWQEGYKAYLKEVNDRLAEHRYQERVKKDLADARAKWEREARPALRKEVLSEINGTEDSPDTASGSPSTNGFIGQDEFNANRGNSQWLRAHKAEWTRSIEQGLIRY